MQFTGKRPILAPVLLVATFLGWAALTLWVFTTDVVSAAALVPLMVLVAGFEAIAISGSKPLFAIVFFLATVVNYLPAAISGTVEELAGIGFIHVLFAVRILIATRRAATRPDTTNNAPST
jgi:hypothetical protein